MDIKTNDASVSLEDFAFVIVNTYDVTKLKYLLIINILISIILDIHLIVHMVAVLVILFFLVVFFVIVLEKTWFLLVSLLILR